MLLSECSTGGIASDPNSIQYEEMHDKKYSEKTPGKFGRV